MTLNGRIFRAENRNHSTQRTTEAVIFRSVARLRRPPVLLQTSEAAAAAEAEEREGIFHRKVDSWSGISRLRRSLKTRPDQDQDQVFNHFNDGKLLQPHQARNQGESNWAPFYCLQKGPRSQPEVSCLRLLGWVLAMKLKPNNRPLTGLGNSLEMQPSVNTAKALVGCIFYAATFELFWWDSSGSQSFINSSFKCLYWHRINNRWLC